jgi:glycosyltransferase involved in cell wall biosynthesis
MPEPARILVWYWGRRGGGARYALEAARALSQRGDVRLSLSLSSGNELLAEFLALDCPRQVVDTYGSAAQAMVNSLRLPLLRRRFTDFLREQRVELAFSAMSHLWGPAIVGGIAAAGARFVPAIHDADRHPGDFNPLLHWRTGRELAHADRAVVLSEHVRAALIARYSFPAGRIALVPHGAFRFSGSGGARRHPAGRPFRFLFFGRILPYKGLDRLLAAYAELARQAETSLCIAGSGNLSDLGGAFEALPRVSLVNRWIGEDEIGGFLDQADAMVVPYGEASQSGVAAVAQAAGMPLVVTPVGGLTEQVSDGVTGLVAGDMTPAALAAAMLRLVREPDLYERLSAAAATQPDTWDRLAALLAGLARS